MKTKNIGKGIGDKFSVKNVGKSLVFWILIFGLALTLTTSVNATITPNPNPPTAAGGWPKTVTIGFTFTADTDCPMGKDWKIYLWEDDAIDETVSGSKGLASGSVTCGGAPCIKKGVFVGGPAANPPPVSQTFKISKETCKYYAWGGDIDIYASIIVSCGSFLKLESRKTKVVFIKCSKAAYSNNSHKVTISQLIEDFNDNYAFYMTLYEETTTSSSDRVDIPTWISNKVISNNTYNYTIASDITVNLSIAEFDVSCPPGYTMDVRYTPKGKPTITPDHVYLGGSLFIIDLPVELSNTELNILTITVFRSDNYNHIKIQTLPQKVLIGQDLQFDDFSAPPTVYKVVEGDIEAMYEVGDDYRIDNVNWEPGRYYVNYRTETDYDAQLAVEEVDMPIRIEVDDKMVSSITVGTPITIDTAGMNLFPEDQVDLVVIGPDGQIKYDDVNYQQFTDITVDYLTSHYGYNNLETIGWPIGDYTFQIKTKPEYACGLEAESGVKPLRIRKGEIAIEADMTSAVELETVKLIVTGVAGDKIKVEADPLSEYVIFKEGVDDTPTGADFYGNWFTDVIDSDGIRKYAVEFGDTGTFTIGVTVTEGDRKDDHDTVDITVLEKEVTFYLPIEVVIGDKIKIKGTSTSGTYVSVYVDDTLYDKLVDIVIEDGEFEQEVMTTRVGMNLRGSVRLKAWIDCDKAAGEDPPSRSPDGEDVILVSRHTLTAELSVPSVALEDDFRVLGTAKGQTEVVILSVPPKGGGGKSLLDKGQKGLSPRKASVSMMDYTYSKKMTVQEDATAGYYDIYVLSSGMDGVWSMTGEADLEAALDEICGIPSLTEGVITTKTQAEINDDILEDFVYTTGSDDLMRKLRLKVETAYVRLDPVATVNAGAPLAVKGTSNRQQGYVIVVTCKGPVELIPQTVKIENGAFECVFDTTTATTGNYIVKADDGDGHVDEVDVFITGKTAHEIEKAVEEAAEVAKEIIEEITATPTPTPEPTPQPPGSSRLFAIAGLLAVAYLVHRKKK